MYACTIILVWTENFSQYGLLSLAQTPDQNYHWVMRPKDRVTWNCGGRNYNVRNPNNSWSPSPFVQILVQDLHSKVYTKDYHTRLCCDNQKVGACRSEWDSQTYQRKWMTLVDPAVRRKSATKPLSTCVQHLNLMCMNDNSLIPRLEHKIWEWGSYCTYPATDMKAVNCLSSITDVHHWGPTTKAESSECGMKIHQIQE